MITGAAPVRGAPRQPSSPDTAANTPKPLVSTISVPASLRTPELA